MEELLGKGTTFTVTIPTGSAHLPQDRIVEAHEPAIGSHVVPIVTEASQWSKGRCAEASTEGAPLDPAAEPRSRILLVDDSDDMRTYIAGLLRRHWTVDEAADGEEALARVQSAPPDLILTDLMMPRMDGQALIKALRASPATRSVPVIVLSARAGEESVLEGFDLGADAYLVKPFSARELFSRVRGTWTPRALIERAARERGRFRRLAESG
ncbi:MAG: response regulator [Byssovorax sp.]